ncbi:MAG: hypothetical protein RLY86_2091 [Pseudomonadota bacterium]|jgi:arginase
MTIPGRGAPWLALIGAPADVGNYRCGAAEGPQALRAAGVVQRLTAKGTPAVDLGDVAGPAYDGTPDDGTCRSLRATAAWCGAVRDLGTRAFAEGGIPLLLGGDHSLVLGSIAAAAAHARLLGRPLHVLWFDAHPDFNTPDTTPSGNTHGFPAASACGYGHPVMLDVGGFTPLMDGRNLTQFAIRDVDAGERRNLERAGVVFHEMLAVRQHGLVTLVARALDAARRQNAIIHISVDTDGLDPTVAPAVGTPVPGGLTLEELAAALRLAGESGLVGSLDLVEYAAAKDQDGATGAAVLHLLESFTAGITQAAANGGEQRQVA